MAKNDYKNFRPQKCARLLLKNGWEFVNREGTHETYCKTIGGVVNFVQVIYNNKTIYWKNARNMVEKTDIPLSNWIKSCK